MIGLGLRLTLAGGREALARLLIMAAGVALGTGLLLATLAATHATTTQNDRNAWLNTAAAPAAAPATADTDPLWWLIRADAYDGRTIGRIDVAATGPQSPVPPGLPRLPGAGEYYASPALAELLRTTPPGELGARYPGRQAGTLGPAALPGPDSLLIVVGRAAGELARVPGAEQVRALTTTTPGRCSGPDCVVRAGIDADGITLILSVVAVALIFPVLILIGTATRLSAARREQRFAAMRLVGATPRQISAIAAVESALAAALGAAAGFALCYAARPLIAEANLTGTPFFTGDLALDGADIALVAAGVPAAAAAAAWIALRRVRISPLGVTRRVTPRPPRIHRLLPLVLGLGILAYAIGRVPRSTGGQVLAFIPGILLVLAGLIIAGPWLTMAGARLLARRTARPALLIAGRRLADDPRAGFRAVSGLVLALCVTSGTIGVITTLLAESGTPPGREAAAGTVILDFGGSPAAPPADSLLGSLRAGAAGVAGVAVIRTNPLGTPDPGGPDMRRPAGLVSCAELAAMPVFGTCPAGAQAASVTPDFSTFGAGFADNWPAVWPAADLPAARLRALPAQQIVVATDGTTAALERARTTLTLAYPDAAPPSTTADFNTWRWGGISGYQQLANVVILISLPIAGCSLAVSVAGGLSDRKRPFSLLRLTGVPLGVLRRVVLVETAVPLLTVAAVAIATGFLAAHLFLRAQFEYSLHAPAGAYYVLVASGLAASLAVIASALPLLRRTTGPQTARND